MLLDPAIRLDAAFRISGAVQGGGLLPAGFFKTGDLLLFFVSDLFDGRCVASREGGVFALQDFQETRCLGNDVFDCGAYSNRSHGSSQVFSLRVRSKSSSFSATFWLSTA